MFIVGLLIQLVILVVAMVLAGLIIRWILANPEKVKVAWKGTRRRLATPGVHYRALRAYRNWKKVGMGFGYKHCVAQEWDKYDAKHNPPPPYYRL